MAGALETHLLIHEDTLHKLMLEIREHQNDSYGRLETLTRLVYKRNPMHDKKGKNKPMPGCGQAIDTLHRAARMVAKTLGIELSGGAKGPDGQVNPNQQNALLLHSRSLCECKGPPDEQPDHISCCHK